MCLYGKKACCLVRCATIYFAHHRIDHFDNLQNCICTLSVYKLNRSSKYFFPIVKRRVNETKLPEIHCLHDFILDMNLENKASKTQTHSFALFHRMIRTYSQHLGK